MDLKKVVLKVLNFHTEDIDDSLDEDQRRAAYIQNPFLKVIYLILFNISMYLIAFLVVYFTLTGQLEHINLFGFFSKTKHIMLAVLVTVLTLAVKGLRDYVLPKVNEITKRKLLNVLLDVVRMSNFTTLYFFTIWVLIGKTTKPTLNHTKYMIFLILMLFIARKLIFWILFAFKNDEQARKVFEKVKPKIPEQVELHNKIKEMNKLLTRLQKIKEELAEHSYLLKQKNGEEQKIE